MPANHDARLLNNLIQREKDTLQAFKNYTLNSGSAAAALSAWSTADSANTTDIMDASTQIHDLLSSLTDYQRSYLNALTMYRSSLKEVLEREVALRTVVRDREILVNRVIKVGNKKPKDGEFAGHQMKLEDAQRELAACETYLQEEEQNLSEVKRRSFREALAFRMKSMGELGRVMEDVAIEALDVLAGIDGPGGPENGDAFNPDLYRDNGNYEIGSDAGESIAPFDSASQAMSRASSTTSLNEENQRREQQPQAVPTLPVATSRSQQPNGTHARQSTTDSIASPAASRPASHIGGRSTHERQSSSISRALPPPQPVMPPVPTAPRAISQVAYTERHEGLPTFEIPKAPDLSRRPDESSDEEEEEQHQPVQSGRRGGGGGSSRRGGGSVVASQVDYANQGVPASMRSRSYPLDSPGLSQPSGGGRLGFPKSPSKSTGSRRRAMSDSSSIDDRGPRSRKRSGSFFGGIAAMFRRKGKKQGSDDEREDDNGEVDYYEGRDRLAQGPGGGGGGASWGNSRTGDDVLAAVMGAGVRSSGGGGRRGGNRDDSSDDDEPRNVVRNVNDPKQRIKAMSDIGRAPKPTVSTGSSRPVLTRKGTSTSTVRPMSMIAQPVTRPAFVEKNRRGGSEVGSAVGGSQIGGEPKKKVKKVKKAASDIGISTTGWNSTIPSSQSYGGQSATTTILPKPASTNAPPPAPPPVPHVVQNSPPAADTGSIKKKKKKSVKEPSETVILSAEALGIPSAAAGGPTPQSAPPSSSPAFAPSRPAGVSRSNTVTSSTSLVKKKKKKAPSVVGSIAEEPSTTSSKPLPTADDLAKSLPTARSSTSPLTASLPRPDDNPYPTTATRPTSTPAPTPAQPAPSPKPAPTPAFISNPSTVKSQKSKLAAEEKRNKRHSQLHGEGNWVSLPPSAHPVGQPSAQAKTSRRTDAYEGEESLLAVVDRAGVIDSAKPSRTYTGSKPNSGTATPVTSSTPASPKIPSSVSTPNVSATPKPASIPSSPSAGPAWLTAERGVGAGTAATSPVAGGGLSKRKSVRLADNSNLTVPSPNPHHTPASPASSIRSASSPPRPILVNSPARGGSPNPTSSSSAGDWPTRASIRASMMDSSDEEDGDGGYLAARKALRRGTKEMEAVYSNGGNKVDKGKGKAVN